ILIVNDAQGALTTALSSYETVSWGDSYLSELAARENLTRNGIDESSVEFVPSTAIPEGPFDLVIIKVPKHHALLEQQLIELAPMTDSDTKILGAGMTRHIHTSALDAFETILGPTRTSRAAKKARLIHTTRDASRPKPAPIERVAFRTDAKATIISLPGVFSSKRLDAGTRTMLEHLPVFSGSPSIVDLGCGNGVLGVSIAQQNPDAAIAFVDESHNAVASAAESYAATIGKSDNATFIVGDGLSRFHDHPPLPNGSIDIIVNNPPFHDDHAVGDATAWQMFGEAHDALRVGGEIWVVGNQHLDHHIKLHRRFGNCDVVGSNPKFVVMRATKTAPPQ
ncbi:UNVERIFIED_CONTAM: hypothetical protein GTU68_000485, partial [Idotea baltica]|nr:hypothetical protein [Idotea baltica]